MIKMIMSKPGQRKYFENGNNVLFEKFTMSLLYLFFFGSMRFVEIYSNIRTNLHPPVQHV